jgi:hypothetical protein
MLEIHPVLKLSVMMFAKQNLKELSAEIMCNYMHMIALPELLQQWQEELGDNNFEIMDLLRKSRLTKLTLTTV